MFVYFIQAASGPIKIGQSSYPEGRLRVHQISNHEKLTLLFYCDDRLEKEKTLLERFAVYNIHGEWFAPVSEILQYINVLKERNRQLSTPLPFVTEKPDPKDFLRITMESKNMGRLHLAKHSGVPVASIAAYLSGNKIGESNASRIAKVLDINPRDLLRFSRW